MTSNDIKPGQTIIYNDGRPGHQNVSAEVLSVTECAMVVQFSDRADTTTIKFCDRDWMQFITVKPCES